MIYLLNASTGSTKALFRDGIKVKIDVITTPMAQAMASLPMVKSKNMELLMGMSAKVFPYRSPMRIKVFRN